MGPADTHLITAQVEPTGTWVQPQDLLHHCSHQRQGLRLVGVQGVGERCHLPEVCKSLVFQHELRREQRAKE